MKKTLFKNKFIAYSFDEETNTFEEVFFEASEHMSEDEYKHLTKKMAELLYECKPQKIYADMRKLFYGISVELQAWADEVLGKAVKDNEIEKSAIVASENFIAQIALELVVDEENIKTGTDVKFFDNEEEARNWLLE